MADQELVVYSNGCVQCKILQSMMDKHGLEYIVDSNMDSILAVADANNIKNLPMLDIGDKILTFREAKKFVESFEVEVYAEAV